VKDDTGSLLSGLVHLGLAAFWEQALPADDPRYRWLLESATARLGPDWEPHWPARPEGQARQVWDALMERVGGRWPPAQGPLGRLIADLGLTPAGALVLALVGAFVGALVGTLGLVVRAAVSLAMSWCRVAWKRR